MKRYKRLVSSSGEELSDSVRWGEGTEELDDSVWLW